MKMSKEEALKRIAQLTEINLPKVEPFPHKLETPKDHRKRINHDRRLTWGDIEKLIDEGEKKDE